jgi:Phosphotransferase enzyme family
VGRTVTLVLLDGTGAVLGTLPPFAVPVPYRQEVACIVDGARERFGIEVVVLRLMRADGPAVTYLAELAGGTVDTPLTSLTPVTPISVNTAPHPLRAPYALPGGPAATLAWAAGVLGPVSARQLRTWNLSSIWRLEHASGTAWLKEVPAFFRHEGAVLGFLARRFPGLAPTPIGVDGGRMLLADVPGEDRYRAAPDERLPMLAALHRVQLAAVGDLPALRALGVPDRGFATLAARMRAVATRYGYPDLLDGLDARLAEVDACGLPDTLVHGDFHPGNVRGSVLLDWGDCVLGHPGYDLLRMVADLPAAQRVPLVAQWCDRWRVAVPGCRPERALAALEPVAALRNAMVYADFLDRIEPDEHGYHRDDVPFWLDRARALWHGGTGP